MKKRIATAFICVIAAVVLCACGGSDADKAAKMAADELGIEDEEDIRELKKLYEEALEEEREPENPKETEEPRSVDTEDLTKPLNGIICMTADRSPGELYPSEICDVSIYNIDPDTGEYEKVRFFQHVDTSSIELKAFWDGIPYQSQFSPDFSLMTQMVKMADGAYHVGWVDQYGVFTDVSEMIYQDLGDFGNTICKHHGAVFNRDGDYFYFCDNVDSISGELVKRVPVNDISAETVEILFDNYHRGHPLIDYNGYPVEENILHNPTGEMEYSSLLRIVDWVDSTHALRFNMCNVDMTHYFSYEKHERDFFPFDDYKIIPDVNNRVSLNPILSPDKTKVAFLSYDKGSNQAKREIFITSADGQGQPKKLSTDFDLRHGALVTSDMSYAPDTATLIDWVDGSAQSSANADVGQLSSSTQANTPYTEDENEMLDRVILYSYNTYKNDIDNINASVDLSDEGSAVIELTTKANDTEYTVDIFQIDLETMKGEDLIEGYEVDLSTSNPDASKNLVESIRKNNKYRAYIMKPLSDEELIKLAKNYFKKKYNETPPIVKIDHKDGDEVSIYLGEETVAWNWFTVNCKTCKGTDVTLGYIDLNDAK